MCAVCSKSGNILGDVTEETLTELQKKGLIVSVDNPLDEARRVLVGILVADMKKLGANYIALDKNAVKEHLISIQIEGQTVTMNTQLKIFHYNYIIVGNNRVEAKGVVIANDVHEAFNIIKKEGKYQVPKENIYFVGNLADVNPPVLFDF